MENTDINKNISIALAAIDKSIIESIPKPIQDEVRGKDYLTWGENNDYPNYLFGLYTDVSTLKTIIDGTAAYVAGDDVKGNIPGFDILINKKGDTWRNFIKLLARDYGVYGGCAYNVIRNKAGKVAELYYIDFRNIRTNKKADVFWYSEEYAKKWGRTSKALVYPAYQPDGDAASSIVYIKNEYTSAYPIPRYSGAIRACEIERNIDEMHLSGLQNGFSASYIINFLNGIPTDEQKAEIEKNVQEKFAGSRNAGRIVLNFANGKDNAATVEKLETQDFGEKYKAAAQRSREQIFCAFQAIPQLFGLMTDNKGFSETEFKEAYNLYSRTVVRDIQQIFVDSIDYVFQTKESITIKPFSINIAQSNGETEKIDEPAPVEVDDNNEENA